MSGMTAEPAQMEQPALNSDCQTCQNLWLQFAKSENRPEVNFGSLDDMASSSCPTHTPLARHFREYCLKQQNNETNDAGIPGGGTQGSSPWLTESIENLGLTWNLLLANREEVYDHPGTGRVLDPEWVDVDIVKHWKNECLASHEKCKNPMKIPFMRPAWLIDVEAANVIPGEDCASFVALSYFWGPATQVRVDGDFMERIRKSGSLDESDITERLPPIIRHAMRLTSIIGERYLWVDALCIVHGDDATTQGQLNLMGAIYANAIITIIATDGDAQCGIRGLQGVSPRRELEQTIIPFGEEKILVRNTGIFCLHDNHSKYYNRGWAYQELKMSPRKLMLVNNEIHWECQCSVWHEELTLGTEIDKYIDPRLHVIQAGFPDWGSLGHAICGYNSCELTYEEDANVGISGLLAIASRAFEGGFLYGLPETMFDRALTWAPLWGHTELRRRKPSDRPLKDHFPSSSLPSWSWVGWQGMVSVQYGEAARINDLQSSIEETYPITSWYTAGSLTGPRRRIRCTWFENRDAFKDLSKPIPPGWTSHTPDVEDRIYPDKCGERVFTHEDMPDDDCREWYYPFPLPSIEPSTPLFTPIQTPYLFCTTKRAFLSACHAASKSYLDEMQNHNQFDLLNGDGKKIGGLHLQNAEQKKRVHENGKNLELVAICRSRIDSKTFNKELKKATFPHTTVEIYKVLWIEWKDGVAYRLACGSVRKDEWDALELEDVSLILG